MVTFVPYHRIDKDKWDKCILGSSNSMVYALSVCLDTIAGKWDALVLGDYEAVMPITYKSKYAIKYLYQPSFLQQGGIFLTGTAGKDLVAVFIKALTGKYKFAEIALNYGNDVPVIKGIKVVLRNNFILNLQNNYDTIRTNYSANLLQELRRLQKFKLVYQREGSIKEAVDLYRKLYAEKIPAVKPADFKNLITLLSHFNDSGNVVCRRVTDGKGVLVALLVLINDGRRLYNIISCLLPEGKKLNANYFLYDSVIREFSQRPLYLDFEGSDNPGIKFFYKKFGVVNQPYPFLKFNNLPKAVRWLKKQD